MFKLKHRQDLRAELAAKEARIHELLSVIAKLHSHHIDDVNRIRTGHARVVSELHDRIAECDRSVSRSFDGTMIIHKRIMSDVWKPLAAWNPMESHLRQFRDGLLDKIEAIRKVF